MSSLVTFDSLALLVFFKAAKTAAPAKSPPTSTMITMITLTLQSSYYLHRHAFWQFLPETFPNTCRSERSERSRSIRSRTEEKTKTRFHAALGQTGRLYFALNPAVNFISPH